MGSLDARLGCGLHVGGVKGRLAGCRIHNPGAPARRCENRERTQLRRRKKKLFVFVSVPLLSPNRRRIFDVRDSIFTTLTATTTTTGADSGVKRERQATEDGCRQQRRKQDRNGCECGPVLGVLQKLRTVEKGRFRRDPFGWLYSWN